MILRMCAEHKQNTWFPEHHDNFTENVFPENMIIAVVESVVFCTTLEILCSQTLIFAGVWNT